ncbi:hypothetical protein [Allofournierella massiliensis]|uniref:Outer membrane protein assembly factor BamB n=1 Tax=Allofournierella massiliensis TaxID=1650663 RepID=A0A4R1QV18_9FIRM|nr:hypothetical protein [Fournierella massiliensis]TCL57407.1 hypothetical protein EDD77_11082 [Fournierella massiliensis]
MNRSTLAKIVSPLALAAMLVACGSQPSGTEMVVHPANDTPITHIANYDMLGDTAASPEGLYEVCSVRLGSCNLLYVDAATRQETYLCATPNCTHDSESCNSYLPLEEGRYGYQLFFFNGYLYAAQCTPIESQGPYLMRMDPDGTNREIVLELENGECFSGMLYGYGDRLLLQISRVDENGNSETCMEIFDPQTGERKRLFSLQLEPGGKESASLMGAAGTSLIFLKSDEEGRQYYKVDLARENPTLEQGQTNLLGPEFDENSLYCTVQGDYFCTYDIAAGRLSWENLLTGQKKEFSLPQLSGEETVYGLALLYDDQFALSMSSSEKGSMNLLLNPETGESTGVYYYPTRESGYDILADFGDELLYKVRTDERPLEGQAAYGLVGEVSYHNVYAMVSKEDFQSGIPGEEIPFPE